MMDGRVKTMHPAIQSGELALPRDHAEHVRAMAEHGIEPIDLVCSQPLPLREDMASPSPA